MYPPIWYYYTRTFVRFQYLFLEHYVLLYKLRIRRSKISEIWKSSLIVDTYFHGLSYRSCIRTCSPLAIFSNVSSLGILPLHSFPIVDFGTPVRIDTCRRDRFFLKIMSAINIFMQTVSAKYKKTF
nr:MAG TPA: hypothetical protein [Caudoviricetes sp.]